MTEIIAAILGLAGNVFGKLTQEQTNQLTLLLQQDKDFNELLKAQANIDANEAQSSNIFVAGWRPMVGWTCAVAFAWQYLLLPISCFLCVFFGHADKVVQLQSLHLDFNTMNTVLMGMLGLGAFRTFEKYTKTANNH